jgi:hypothetical protein
LKVRSARIFGVKAGLLREAWPSAMVAMRGVVGTGLGWVREEGKVAERTV